MSKRTGKLVDEFSLRFHLSLSLSLALLFPTFRSLIRRRDGLANSEREESENRNKFLSHCPAVSSSFVFIFFLRGRVRLFFPPEFLTHVSRRERSREEWNNRESSNNSPQSLCFYRRLYSRYPRTISLIMKLFGNY